MNSSITNLYMEDVDITGDKDVASLVAYIKRKIGYPGDNLSLIKNVKTSGKVRGKFRTGGIFSENRGAEVRDVSYIGEVSGDLLTGGIGGVSAEGIKDITYEGKVEGEYTTGGLIGINEIISSKIPIEDIYFKGFIKGKQNVGGILGSSDAGGVHLTILNCFVDDEINGSLGVGGIAGFVRFGDLENISVNGQINGGDNTGGLVGEYEKICGRAYTRKSSDRYFECNMIRGIQVSANISGQRNVGGLIGYGKEPHISRISLEGKVQGKSKVGGVIGNSSTRAFYGYPYYAPNEALFSFSHISEVNSTMEINGNLSGAIAGYIENGIIIAPNIQGKLVGKSSNATVSRKESVRNVSLAIWGYNMTGLSYCYPYYCHKKAFLTGDIEYCKEAKMPLCYYEMYETFNLSRKEILESCKPMPGRNKDLNISTLYSFT